MEDFYDRVAKKYGGYGFSNAEPQFSTEYPDADPEADFKKNLLCLSNPSKIALDIGCGDGIFAFEVAEEFNKIEGLDSSSELIKIAEQKKLALQINNVDFINGNADDIPYDDNYFDIIFNRRGPCSYNEYSRTLKPNGYYLEIGIGENDARQLKETFGRGQNFGDWTTSRRLRDESTFKALGFEILVSKDYFYNEFYEDRSEFVLFLQGVPIFVDFDPKKDHQLLERYFTDHQRADQITLERHRVVYVLQKIVAN